MSVKSSSQDEVAKLVRLLIDNAEMRTNADAAQRDWWMEDFRKLKSLNTAAADQLYESLVFGKPVISDILNAKPEAGIETDHGKIADRLMQEFSLVTIRDSRDVYIYIDGVYRSWADAVIGHRVEELYRSTQGAGAVRNQFVNEVIGVIRRMTTRPREDFNPRGKLCLLNGILNLDGELTVTPHSPDVLFTVQLPVSYDRDATCSRFERFLEEVLPNPDDRKIIQMMAGSVFEPSQRFQRAFLLYGAGCNGKSTLLEPLMELLGPDAYSTETLQSLSESRFSAAKLWGKLANVCDDIPKKAIRETSFFKMATGGLAMRGEEKFKDAFSFVNTAKLIFCCNVFPLVDDPTNAFWRRWSCVEFPVSFIGREDRTLPEKLRDELPGILNWMIAGTRMLRREGDFPHSASVEAVMEKWQNEADSLRWFVNTSVERKKDGWIPKSDFFQAYTAFCDENDATAKTPATIGRQLPALVPSVRQAKHRIDGQEVRGWAGIAIRVSPVAPDSDDRQMALDETGATGEAGTTYSVQPHTGGDS